MIIMHNYAQLIFHDSYAYYPHTRARIRHTLISHIELWMTRSSWVTEKFVSHILLANSLHEPLP